MKILYVTDPHSGFCDLIYEGLTSARGMPAFIEPLKYFIKLGHEIDFVLIPSEKKKLNINVEWLKGCNFHWVNQYSFLKILSLIKIIKSNDYDFVYGHHVAGVWGNIAANACNIPTGLRYYGTFLGKELENNILSSFKSSPLEALSYYLPKKFLITTNDGTKGDLVQQKICPSNKLYDFYYLLNGVEFSDRETYSKEKLNSLLHDLGIESNQKIVFFPCRYDSWKRHDIAIKAFKKIKNLGHIDIKIIFCGHKSDAIYFANLIELSSSLGLGNDIIFAEQLPKTSLNLLFFYSLATLSLYDYSNLGNVFIEATVAGAMLIVRDDNTTSFLIEDGETGLYANNEDELADKIIMLAENPMIRQKIKERLLLKSRDFFQDWESRSDTELKIILKACRKV